MKIHHAVAIGAIATLAQVVWAGEIGPTAPRTRPEVRQDVLAARAAGQLDTGDVGYPNRPTTSTALRPPKPRGRARAVFGPIARR